MLFKKNFKLKTLFLSLLIINSNYTIAKNLDNINDFYILGDSISYSGDPDDAYGHLRFIPGGSINPNYVDLISIKFTNKKAKNYLYGGTSYAQPGTKITKNLLYPELQTDKNINTLLESKNYHLDSNDVYFFEIGGGDINDNTVYDILSNLINTVTGSFLLPKNLQIGEYLKDKNNDLLLNYKPKVLVNLINKISDAGAKNIIFMNVPDASLAPINMLFHIDILLSTFNFFKINLDFIKKFAGQKVDDQLRPLSNNNPNLSGKDSIREYTIKSYQIQFPFIPKSFHEIFYKYIYSLVHNQTTKFNNSIYNELVNNNNSNYNILYLNLNKLFNEIVDNPNQYGINNIVIPSCTLGTKSSECTDSNTYHQDMHYLFGDWFHPSEYSHKIIANYIISTFNAGIHVASIANHLYSQDIASDLVIHDQLNNNRIFKTTKQLIPFMSYSASLNAKDQKSYFNKNNLNNNLNLGFLYNLNEKLVLGSMLSISLGKNKPFDEFKYNYNLFDIDLFTQYSITDKLWIEASTGAGYLKAKDIKRTIDFGTGGNITEKGSTHANSYNIKSLLGYDFKFKNKYIISPVIGYTYAKYKVNGFKEQGDRSTSMYFKNFNKEVSYATSGLQFNTQNNINNFNYNTQITYNIPVSQKETKVKSAINNSNILFERNVDIKNDKWVAVQLGINKKVKNFNIGANVEYRNTSLKNNKFNYSISINNKF